MLVHRMLTAALLAAGLSVVAVAQQWDQPWYLITDKTGPGTLESRVWDCFPTHTQKIALVDDFIASGRAVKRVTFWGALSSYKQNGHDFIVAFYKTDPTGNCAPNMKAYIYQCVPAKGTVVGVDCRGNKIWKMNAALPFWFIGAKGERYWIQISEVDQESLTPDVPDFFWAFHKRSPNYLSWTSCKALGFDSTLSLFNVADPCDDSDVDMAFQLWP